MNTCSLPCVLLTCSFILRRGSLSAVTQFRVIPLREPSLLEVLLAGGVPSWVSTHASQSLVTHFGSVSTFLSYHHVVLPWARPPHGSYLSQGFPVVVWVLHESGYPPLVLELMALSHFFLLFIVVLSYQSPRLSHGVTLSMFFPTHGYRRVTPSIS